MSNPDSPETASGLGVSAPARVFGEESRDELVGYIADNHGDITDSANAILAAGWRPPARIVTTPDELDALPIGSVVRSNWTGDDPVGFVCVRYSDGWHDCIHNQCIFPLGAGGTATVLHEGGSDV